MLKFNTFRAARYLRSKFVEGKFLLASEGTDLELEMLDRMRDTIKRDIGDVVVSDAFKLTRLSATQVLVSPGEAWFNGLPYQLRSAKDELVSGDNLAPGLLPLGVNITDDSTGRGKLINFNSGSTTPTGLYRVVITASEQIITSVQDPFLQNVNITEDTAQKVRVLYKINVVLDSGQTQTPVPYTNETTQQNLTNQIVVTPTSGGNGELLLVTSVSGSTQIDGRKFELTIKNDPLSGGGNPIPNGSNDQASFANGTLIDSYGTAYHINAIFNDVVSTQVIIRIDSEIGSPQPQLINTVPYTLIKRDVFVQDDTNGTPLGNLFFHIAKIDFNSSSGIEHASRITDLRPRKISDLAFQQLTEQRENLILLSLANLSLDATSEFLTWDQLFSLVNPESPAQTIAASTAALVDGGALIYELNLSSGGALAKGNLSVNVTSNVGSVTSLSAVSLANVSLGNVIVVGSQTSVITAIDDVNHQLTVSPPLTNTGSGTIYQDSYGPLTRSVDENTFTLAVRSGSNVWVGGIMKLSPGETSPYGEGGGGSSGLVKATYLDAVATTLPTGTSYTADGFAVVNNDTVLFTNLSSGNNQVYKVSGVGVSLVWTPQAVFNFSPTPTASDAVIVRAGTEFAQQIAIFNGTNFLVNNTVRYFNGTDFWEQSALQTSTLADNTTGNIYSVSATGNENSIIDFSLSRGGIKETGTLVVTHDGTNAFIEASSAFSGATGVSFSADITGGNLRVRYTTTSTGSAATMKYSVKRWSDGAGGPTGLPNYTPFTGIPVNSAFTMSDSSGTPIHCNNPFNVAGKTRVQLTTFLYTLGVNPGTTVGNLEVYVNGQRYPRFVSGSTLDGFYNEIANDTIEFNTDITTSPLSVEIIKRS